MNPLKWVRWKVLISLLVIFGILYFVGLDPLAHWQINDLGSVDSRARWQVGGVDLGVFMGNFELAELLVATAEAAGVSGPDGAGAAKVAASDEPGAQLKKQEVFSAQLASFDLSTTELLRKRFVVDKIEINTPRMRVERRPDGSTNVGDLGGEAPEGSPDAEGEEAAGAEEARDWLDAAKKWYERIQKFREWVADEEEAEGGGGEGGDGEKKGEIDHYARRATYPFAVRPGVVIHEILARGLEIDFAESDGSAALPSLKNGSLSVTGVSDRPPLHDAPIELKLSGEIEGSPVNLNAVVDFTKEPASYGVTFDAGKLSAATVEAFAGESLPVRLAQGTVGFKAGLQLDSDGKLRVEPLLRFQGVRLERKESAEKIAGVDGQKFVAAFNEASSQLGDEALEIADLRITGTLSEPRFEWGDTVKNLVVSGGKAFARAQLRKAEGKAQELIDKESAKIRGKLEEELGKVPGAKELKEGLKDLVPGAGKEGSSEGAAKESLDSLKKGLFDTFGTKSGKKEEAK